MTLLWTGGPLVPSQPLGQLLASKNQKIANRTHRLPRQQMHFGLRGISQSIRPGAERGDPKHVIDSRAFLVILFPTLASARRGVPCRNFCS